MSSALSGIPIERRRRLAATVGLFSVLFVTMGVVAMTGSTPGVVRVFSGISLSAAVLLGLIAWGISRSVSIDQAEQRLDAAIDAAIDSIAVRTGSPLACGCGHDHDPDELHVRPGVPASANGSNGAVRRPSPAPHRPRHAAEVCSHDGAGVECTHNCDSCVTQEVLRTLRPSPTHTRAQRTSARTS